LVAAWAAAGKTPAPTVRESSPPAGEIPDDIDELRRLHDQENAPPGPHVMPQPPMDEGCRCCAFCRPGCAGKRR
jgi:hypothetical protein